MTNLNWSEPRSLDKIKYYLLLNERGIEPGSFLFIWERFSRCCTVCFSSGFSMNLRGDSNFWPQYISTFGQQKKFSIMPFLDILCVMLYSSRSHLYSVCWYCQSWLEWSKGRVSAGSLANNPFNISLICCKVGFVKIE